MIPIVCLMGPTASGKTGLAVELAEQHNYEIISVDSALIYKGMDIGTAKPDSEVLVRAPHKLIDLIDPRDSYSVADFLNDASNAIDEVVANGKKPLLVGGTMMYFNALKKGLAKMPEANATIRAQIEYEAAQFGWGHIHKELQKVDSHSANRIHPNDPQRLGRALEVFRLTGKSMTQFWQEQTPNASPYKMIDLAVMPMEREILHDRIESRFDVMMQQGFLEEVQGLHSRGDLDLELPSMRCVGYRQLWQYLDGQITLNEAVYRGVVATRQLAKRQITWLRGWDNLTIFNSLEKDLVGQALNCIQSEII